MPNGNERAVVYLKKPIRLGSADYSIIYCRPKLDVNSPLSSVSNNHIFIDLGVGVSDTGLSVSFDSIESIVWDNTDGAIEAILASQLEPLQGFVNLT